MNLEKDFLPEDNQKIYEHELLGRDKRGPIRGRTDSPGHSSESLKVKLPKLSKIFKFCRREKRIPSYQRKSMKKKYYAINGLIRGDVLQKVCPCFFICLIGIRKILNNTESF